MVLWFQLRYTCLFPQQHPIRFCVFLTVLFSCKQCFLLLSCQVLSPVSCRRCRCQLPHAWSQPIFSSSAYMPAKAKALERPLGRSTTHADTLQLHNVAGDGRCGYRSLALFLGVTWKEVMQRLVSCMVASGTFPHEHVVAMILACNPRNPCPASCWLSSKHISLLAMQAPDWFQQGIFVAKLRQCNSYIHFQCDGDVRFVDTVPDSSCVLALLTDRKSVV